MAGQIYLLDLAAQQARWLTAKQTTIAGNVANVNTPGYRAQRIEPFADIMDKTRLTLAATQAGHLGAGAGELRGAAVKPAEAWDVTHSGNSVSLEQEMMQAGEVNRSYALNTSIVKAFHRMYLSSVKG